MQVAGIGGSVSLLAPGDKTYHTSHSVAHFRSFRIFANFANLKDFESRTVWEEALGSRRLYGINCRAHRALRYKSKIIRIGPELMKLLRFSLCFRCFLLIKGFQLTNALGRSGWFKTNVWDEL